MLIPNSTVIVKPILNPYYRPLMTMFEWWYYTIYFTAIWQQSALYRPDYVCQIMAERQFAFQLDGIYSYN